MINCQGFFWILTQIADFDTTSYSIKQKMKKVDCFGDTCRFGHRPHRTHTAAGCSAGLSPRGAALHRGDPTSSAEIDPQHKVDDQSGRPDGPGVINTAASVINKDLRLDKSLLQPRL